MRATKRIIITVLSHFLLRYIYFQRNEEIEIYECTFQMKVNEGLI